MTSPPQQPGHQPQPRAIVLPDVHVDGAKTLADEFCDFLPIETIERAVAAARHALERSHRPASPEEVDRLAREHLQARVATLTGRRR